MQIAWVRAIPFEEESHKSPHQRKKCPTREHNVGKKVWAATTIYRIQPGTTKQRAHCDAVRFITYVYNLHLAAKRRTIPLRLNLIRFGREIVIWMCFSEFSVCVTLPACLPAKSTVGRFNGFFVGNRCHIIGNINSIWRTYCAINCLIYGTRISKMGTIPGELLGMLGSFQGILST